MVHALKISELGGIGTKGARARESLKKYDTLSLWVLFKNIFVWIQSVPIPFKHP